MTRFTSRALRKPRWGIAAAVLLIHALLIAALIRAFTPELAATATRAVIQAFTLDAKPPKPRAPAPSVTASAAAMPSEEAAAGAPASQAVAREVVAPKAPIVVEPTRAPPIVGHGSDDASGANLQGEGTGADGAGSGAGAGSAGGGGGGGGGRGREPAVRIAGEISSAKDYPAAGRPLRIGASVVVDLAVGIDGRVTSCRVVQPSPDSQADRTTCELATRRFRFRPALDNKGSPVEAVYRWRQRWFY